MVKSKNSNVYELMVIQDADNSSFRQIKINGESTLKDLAEFILESFDFDNDHLYLFNMDNNYYNGVNTYSLVPQEENPEDKSVEITLNELNLRRKQLFQFWYDFGDDWFFTIAVEKIEDYDDRYKKPVIITSLGELSQYGEMDDEDWDEEDF
ncbi:MAG: plasmid pRiA4b ORF-3 family protein [Methanobrevibacter sp.]|jgi:shikimate kinase|nr:plasmid pRiA4b ORF-3 family protein [Candidatus Methanoflexus mossambicus]